MPATDTKSSIHDTRAPPHRLATVIAQLGRAKAAHAGLARSIVKTELGIDWAQLGKLQQELERQRAAQKRRASPPKQRRP